METGRRACQPAGPMLCLWRIRLLCVLCVLCACPALAQVSTASPTNLGVANDYNLFVLGNATQNNTDTEGRIAVGGNLTLANYDVAGRMGDGDSVHLVVGGQLETTNGQIHGSAHVGGDVKFHNPTLNGNLQANGALTLEQ